MPPNTLVVVTFDEADFEKFYETGEKYNYDGPNQIYTVLLGDMIEPGQEDEGYNHYSLLKTIEQNFNLGSLHKNDEHANWFRFLWNEHYYWFDPKKIEWDEKACGDTAPVQMATAALDDLLYQFNVDADGAVTMLTVNEFGSYSHAEQPEILSNIKTSKIAAASNDQRLILALTDTQNTVHTFSFSLQRGWHSLKLTDTEVNQIAVTPLNGNDEFVLVTQNNSSQSKSATQSYRLHQGNWQAGRPGC